LSFMESGTINVRVRGQLTMKNWTLVFLSSLLGCITTAAGAQPVSPTEFLQKLRAAQKITEPFVCKEAHTFDTPIKAYSEIDFYNGCKILFDVPANTSCCVGLSADIWRFPDAVGSAYAIGYAAVRAHDGTPGHNGNHGRDYDRGDPGGGALDGGRGDNGTDGEPGQALPRPGSAVLIISDGVYNATRRLKSDEIAKLSVIVNFSGAAGGQGGVGGDGGGGGNGEGGSAGSGVESPPPGHCGGGHGGGPAPAARRSGKPQGSPNAACEGDGQFRCTLSGKRGGNGGAGGNAGAGGKGGDGSNASNLDIYAKNEVLAGIGGRATAWTSSWQLILFGGQGGPPGAAGNPGAGGLEGLSGQPCGGGKGSPGRRGELPNPQNKGKGADGKPGKLVLHPS
jgi:hypothetical protein